MDLNKGRLDNSPARWKASFLTLGDDAFFDILRNYLGDFPTPFNKHQLMVSLENFLRRPEIQQGLCALVNERDARILSAIQLLPSPGEEDLIAFFQEEPEARDLPYILLNLQDRLLIYLDRSGEKEVFLLNPYLEEDLAREILDSGRLFSSSPPPRRKVPELPDVGQLLENLDSPAIPWLIQALKTLRLVSEKDDILEPNHEAMTEFAELPKLARLCLLISSGRREKLNPAWKEAELLGAFLPALGSHRTWTKRSLILLGQVASQSLGEKTFLTEEILEDLQELRILLPVGKDSGILNPRLWGGDSLPSSADLSPLSLGARSPEESLQETPKGSPKGIYFPRPFSPPPLVLPLPGGDPVKKLTSDLSKKIREELLKHLATAELPEDQVGEIRERIRRGLIIFPEQIRPDLVRRERAEARGLDYNGKVLVIRQALDDGFEDLEIQLHNPDGSTTQFRLRPRDLRKEENELILRGEKESDGEDDGEDWEFPVRKISLVRRFRSFLIR